jgi:hypothetical protein
MTRATGSAAARRARRGLAALALAAAVAACDGGPGSPRVRIDLDVPEEDAMGALLGDINALEFRVSDGQEFVSGQLQQIADGLPRELELPDVPTGDDVLFDLSGLDGDAVLAYGRTCRLLVDGQGGDIGALLYFSRVGRFRAGDPPLEPSRSAGLMFADDRGRAVVTGGSQDDQVVELFDPRVGSFSPQGEAVPRLGGAIAVRADGTAVIAGGMDGAGAPVGVVEQFNPGSQAEDERIVQLGPGRQTEAERTGLGLAALADGGVLLTGGRTAEGDISAGVALLAGGDDQFRPVAALTRQRAGHTTSVGLGGVAYIIGGLSVDETSGSEVVTGSIELFRPEDTGVRAVNAALAVPRFGHTATVLDDGRILLVGGKTAREGGCGPETAAMDCFDPVEQVELFDPIVDEVRAIDSINFGAVYDHTATLLTGGRVLITGGTDASGNPRSDAWLFDPGLEALVPTRAMSRARARHSATELCDGTVLLVGGDTDDGEPPPSERYSPASTRPP